MLEYSWRRRNGIWVAHINKGKRVTTVKAVITVVGKDCVGILARVSAVCAEKGANIVGVTQSILEDMFCMIMIAEIDRCESGLVDLADTLERVGRESALVVRVMHEDIFNSMHRI